MGHREELESVFREVFDDDGFVLRPDITASDIEGWDSNQQVSLLVAIEGRFQIRFTTPEILRLMTEGSTIGTLLEILDAKLGAPLAQQPRSRVGAGG
jgi:acyl carrier protein